MKVVVLGFNNDGARASKVWVDDVEVNEDNRFLDYLYKTIGCDLVDVTHGPMSIDIWVDDEGLFTKREQPNMTATMLRSLHLLQWNGGNGVVPHPPLFGTAVLCGCDAEGNSVGLNDRQIAYLNSIGFRLEA